MSKFDPRKTRRHVSDLERRQQAYQYWLEGHTYAQVAEEFEYHDKAAAYRAIAAVKREWSDETAEAREQAFNRIMGPLLAMRALAVDGDPAAAGQYKALEERLAKMHGLDMPVKTDITTDGEKITIQVTPDWQTGQE